MADRQGREQRFGRAILIRAVEQRLLDLYAEGHLHGTVHTCVGQEFTGVAVAEALEAGGGGKGRQGRCAGPGIAGNSCVPAGRFLAAGYLAPGPITGREIGGANSCRSRRGVGGR